MNILRTLTATTLTLCISGTLASAQATQPNAVPATQRQTVTYQGPENAFGARGVPLQVLVQMFAAQKHLSLYVLPGTPNPTVNIIVRDITSAGALSHLLTLNGIDMRVNGKTLTIGSPSMMDIQFNTGNTRIATIGVGGLDPTVIANNPQYFTTLGTVIWADPTHHAIIVRGTPHAIEQLREDIAHFDPIGFSSADYRLNNGQDPKDVLSMIMALDPPVAPDALVADPSNDGILIRGTPDYVQRVQSDLVSYVDHPRDAVTYDATIYEVDPDSFDSNRGITLGQSQTNFQAVGAAAVSQVAPPIAGTAILGFPLKAGLNISAQFNMLEERGKATILRRATLIAANGTESDTGYTEDVPFPITDQYTGITTIRTVSTGVTFKVKPIIGQHNLLTQVYLDYSDIAGTGAQNAPIVVHRQSEVTVPTYGQDQAVMISGLYSDDESDSVRGIPPFNHLFIIGHLFQNHQYNHRHSEIVLILIPHIMAAGSTQVPVRFPNVPQSIINQGIDPATPGATPQP